MPKPQSKSVFSDAKKFVNAKDTQSVKKKRKPTKLVPDTPPQKEKQRDKKRKLYEELVDDSIDSVSFNKKSKTPPLELVKVVRDEEASQDSDDDTLFFSQAFDWEERITSDDDFDVVPGTIPVGGESKTESSNLEKEKPKTFKNHHPVIESPLTIAFANICDSLQEGISRVEKSSSLELVQNITRYNQVVLRMESFRKKWVEKQKLREEFYKKARATMDEISQRVRQLEDIQKCSVERCQFSNIVVDLVRLDCGHFMCPSCCMRCQLVKNNAITICCPCCFSKK